MFLKPYKIKSNSPLGGKDIKRFKQRVQQSFANLTPEQIGKLIHSNVSQVKIVTHGDFTTCIYCVEKLPMFFEIAATDASATNMMLVPTLYALWTLDILPFFTTHKNVLNNLANGADLMLPGVIPLGVGPNMFGRFKRGALVAINLTSNLSAHGVGYLAHSSEDLYMSGGRGVAVKMLHIFGDKLWGHEPSMTQQVPNHKPAPLTQDDFPTLGEEPKKSKSSPVTFANILSSLGDSKEEMSQLAELSLAEKESVPENETLSDKVAEAASGSEPIEQSPEQILKNAFLAALKNNVKTLQLPLLTSTFFRQYMVPELQQPLDLKHTKYKKFSNFLKEMMAENFLIVKEESKGVDKIFEINAEHEELLNLIIDHKSAASIAKDDSQNQPLFHSELTETYIVSGSTAKFFAKLNHKLNEPIPALEVKKIIREYTNKYRLQTADPVTKALQLDDTLKEICGKDSATLKEITSTVMNLMEHSYQMCTAKDVKGNKPLIQLSLATRSGNKKVTLIHNLECYGIILPEFMKICKQGAAASITVVQLPNQTRQAVQIQGNQIRFIHNLLTQTYKIQPKFILGLESAKPIKKQKK